MRLPLSITRGSRVSGAAAFAIAIVACATEPRRAPPAVMLSVPSSAPSSESFDAAADAPDGAACDPSSCATGKCGDGVCCDEACDGTCRSCRVPGHEGTCTLVPARTDPDHECPTGYCDGRGQCAEHGRLVWLRHFTYVGAAPWYKRGTRSYSLGSLDQCRMVLDARGEIIVVAHHRGSIDFGKGAQQTSGPTGIVVAKLDKEGHARWSRAFRDRRTIDQWIVDAKGSAPQTPSLPYALVEKRDAVAIVGQDEGALDVGAGAASGRRRIYWLELDAETGVTRAARAITGTGIEMLTAAGPLSGGEGVLVAGSVTRAALAATAPGQLFTSARLVRLDARGRSVWTKTYEAMDAWIHVLRAARDGGVYVGGDEYSGMSLGNEDESLDGDGYDPFVVKLSADGRVTSKWNPVGPGAQTLSDFAVDRDDRVIMLAMLQGGSFDVGGEKVTPRAIRDTLLLSFSGSSAVFGKRYGESGYQNAGAAAADARGEIAIVGDQQTGRVDFGAGVIASDGSYGGWIAKIDATGKTLWSRAIDGPNDQHPTSVAIDADDSILIGGTFRDHLVIGDENVDAPGDNLFVAKLTP